jgi:hypothetical protein
MITNAHSCLRFFRHLTALLPLLLLGAQPGFAAEGSNSLNLVYTGSGTVMANQTSFENHYNPKTRKYEHGTATTTTRKPFTGSGYVEIAGATARIKLPSAMVPLFSGGNDGWFPINDFFMNDREITGTVRINALNKPKLRIDRNTGILTIAGGFSDLTGQCELLRNDPSARKF